MFVDRVINMNSLEKKSFYYFLTLYILSSTLFIFVSAYWYYTAQYNLLEKNEQQIISAHMSGSKLEMPPYDKSIKVALVDTKSKVVFGKLMDDYVPKKSEYFLSHGHNILSSDAPQQHLNIDFVVLSSGALYSKISDLKQSVIGSMILSIFVVVVLAWILGKIFMKPLHTRIKQIEDFVHDTAHELNTPITALSMSVSRAIKKDSYDNKLLKNISVSTKQLFDIYNALSYLSFESSEEELHEIEVCGVLKKSVEYYEELAQSKTIILSFSCDDFSFKMDETKLSMLFGNLINNAIKYSYPESKIMIEFKDGVFKIQDFGIGIPQDKLKSIFDRFNRETNHAGGFGIGLSIVKKISDEYGLSISVDSKIDEGTMFIVDFKAYSQTLHY